MANKHVHVRIDPDIMESVYARLASPVYQRTIRGNLSALIEQLLLEWLKAQHKDAPK